MGAVFQEHFVLSGSLSTVESGSAFWRLARPPAHIAERLPDRRISISYSPSQARHFSYGPGFQTRNGQASSPPSRRYHYKFIYNF